MSINYLKYTKYYLTGLLLFLVGGTVAFERRKIDPNLLSGNISLTLKHGVWKEWEKRPTFQDITLDLVCTKGQCQPEIWAFAPKFNKDVDHSGNLKEIKLEKNDGYWILTARINIQTHPEDKHTKVAKYKIRLITENQELLGTYWGSYNDRSLGGKVTGKISPYFANKIANFQVVIPQEHPRLIFRRSQLPELRQKAETEAGKIILARLKETLKQKIYYNNAYVPNGGYHAAGHCFLYQINDDKQAAETAWQITEKALRDPGRRRILERSTTVAGVAMAFDLCYDAWDFAKRKQVAIWLNDKLNWLIAGDSPKNGWNSYSWSNWNARGRGAAGLAALVLFNEPKELFDDRKTDIDRNIKIAERNITRYLQIGIGNRGLGTEGDLYSTEPWALTVIPFLHAYGNVMGEDLITNSSAAWFLPHYIARLVGTQGKLQNGGFGRYYLTPSGSIFAVGLPTVKPEFLPAVMWFFERNFGLQGNRSFGVDNLLPYQAIYAFLGYRSNLQVKNPADIFGKVLVDEQKGFYVLRNRFQDNNDFVASIYLKKQPLQGSWSFPDVGSFRILGLGEEWAIPNLDGYKRENENVALVDNSKTWQQAEPISFSSKPDGSGIVSLKTNPITSKYNGQEVGLINYRSFAADYSNLSGSPALFVIVDNFIGNNRVPDFQQKTWIMNTQGKITLREQGFTIHSNNGTTMEGTFIEPFGVQLSTQKTKNGSIIKATGGDFFFVVMTVQKGKAHQPIVEGSNIYTKVKVGKQTISYQDHRIVLAN
jgi:hypothetical protein